MPLSQNTGKAALDDRSDIGTDAHTVTDLFEALRNEDCVLYAHVRQRGWATSSPVTEMQPSLN